MSSMISGVGVSTGAVHASNQVFGVPPRVYDIATAITRIEGGDDITRLVIEDTAENIADADNFAQLKEWAGDKILKGIRVTDGGEVNLKIADLQGTRAEVANVLKRLQKATVNVEDTAANLLEATDGRTGLDELKLYQRRLDGFSVATEDADGNYAAPTLSLSAEDFKANRKVLGRLEGALIEVELEGNYSDYAIKAGKRGAISAKGTETFKGVANFLKFAGDETRVFATSGDARIDAILQVGKLNMWSPSAQGGQLAVNSSAENESADDVQQLSPGVVALDEDLSSADPIALTFGFHETSATVPARDGSFFVALDERQKAVVRDAFNYLGSLINVTFEEETLDAETSFQFGTNEQESSAAYAYMPTATTENGTTQVMLANNVSTNDFSMLEDDDDPSDGDYTIDSAVVSELRSGYGWTTLLHEIGHALGLKHPGNYNAGGGGADQPYLPKSLDSRQWTMMSYSDAPAATITAGTGTATRQNSQTAMVYDLAALQFLYGQSADDTYLGDFQTTTFESDWNGFQTVWSPDSITFDLSARDNDVIVDMRPGTYSSVSRFNDSGLAFGSTYGDVTTGGGDDVIYAGLYTASVDGGDGDDAVYLAGDATDYGLENEEVADDGSIDATAIAEATRTVDGEDITISLSNVEKIKFYDNTRVSGLHSIDNLA